MRLLGAILSTKVLATGFGVWAIYSAGQIVIEKLDAVSAAIGGAGF